MKTPRILLLLAIVPLLPSTAPAWDYDGHRLVNQLALASLPGDFPAFVREPAAAERVAFLSCEADRWRNTPDLTLKHANHPDHFLDIEDLAQFKMAPRELSPFRYEFTEQLGAARALNPAGFPKADPAGNADRTKGMTGYLPWTIAEYYAKLKSAFSYLRALEEAGTAEEVSNARENVVYYMGVMGHFVGDAAQPLHTTRNYNGWVDANPNGYTTSRRFHAWIDGGYLKKVGLRTAEGFKGQLRPAKLLWHEAHPGVQREVFPVVMDYILAQHELVEPLYQMDKQGKLSGDGETGLEGKAILEGQILKAGQMLGDLWYSAWKQAPADTYLKARLLERQISGPGAAEKTPAQP